MRSQIKGDKEKMYKTILSLAVVISLSNIVVFAQQPKFTTPEEVEMALDQISAPISQIISGAPLTSANTLGGLPHFRIGAGVQTLFFSYRDPSTKDTVNVPIPSYIFSGKLGIFPGIRVAPGVGGILAVDALFRYGFFPVPQLDYPKFNGFGIRIGLMRDKGFVPALSASVMMTRLGKITYQQKTLAFGGEAHQVVTYKMDVISFRADFSKRLAIFSPYIGVGLDKFESDATYDYKHQTLGWQYNKAWNFKKTVPRSYGGIMFGGAGFSVMLEGGSSEGGRFHAAVGTSIGF